MRAGLVLLVLLAGAPVLADRVEAVRVIRAHEVIAAGDVVLRDDPAAVGPGLQEIIGKEARVALYPGRPIRAGDVTTPAVIERNQMVPLVYMRGGLQIEAEGRALGRAGPGDYVRVMNLASRATVTGRVTEDGKIKVSR
jgi:flagella basal body P-ring formation protein FlgA